MAASFATYLQTIVKGELYANPQLQFFGCVVNRETNTAEVISTSKFSLLLNQSLLRDLTAVATAPVDEPLCVGDAVDRMQVVSVPLALEPFLTPRSDDELAPHTPRQRPSRTPQRPQSLSPQHVLEPDAYNYKPYSPRKRKSPTVGTKSCLHQTIDETLDVGTKQKLIRALVVKEQAETR